MRFSQTELKVLGEIAKANQNIADISRAIRKSKYQVYRCGQKLALKGFIRLNKGCFEPERSTLSGLLLQLLDKFPSVIRPLSGSGTGVFIWLLEPKSVDELIRLAGIKRTQVFKKIKQAASISMLIKEGRKYRLNEKLWTPAIMFFQELALHEKALDSRVPVNSEIYHKNEKEIIFSNKGELDAAKTAFSAYETFGIKLLLVTNYYYLPKRTLSLKEVFMHSLYVAQKTQEIRHFIYVALFYAKHKTKLPKISNNILNNLRKALEGEKIPGYPSYEEIKSRARVYDIKL